MQSKMRVSSHPSFDEQKITEAASILLQMNGGRMPYLRLLKLLYLADREALEKWERPITTDHHVSMKYGPTPSNTYDIIMQRLVGKGDYWHSYITRPKNYSIQLKGDPPKMAKLSRAEIDLLKEVYEKHREKDRWALSRLTHRLPEFHDPGDSSIPIPLEEILEALQFTKEDIKRIRAEIQLEANIEAILGA